MAAELNAAPLRVGILGLGTVGSGVVQVLARNREEILRRTGRELQVTRIAVRDLAKARALVADASVLTTDAEALVRDPAVDIVVELIGGTEAAHALVRTAIEQGKHVVTANKALLAMHGNTLLEAARDRGVIVAFEAAVAGGIPIIKALREGLAANRIEWVAGIINGTTNFILSEMRDKGLDFADVLKEAQRLGYAEADPTFDIEGVDAAHKLAILSAIAFGTPMAFDRAHVEGISALQATDIRYAEQLGYRIKLIGLTRRRDDAGGVELRVHPTLVPAKRLIASVEGPMNAVMVQGDAVGSAMYYGRGAGSEPTASAVVADLVDIARLADADPSHRVPALAFHPESLQRLPVLPIEQCITAFYLRLRVVDEAGVLSRITTLLAEHDLSIDAVLQRESGEGSHQTDLVILTHRAPEHRIRAALARIEALRSVLAPVVALRKEDLA